MNVWEKNCNTAASEADFNLRVVLTSCILQLSLVASIKWVCHRRWQLNVFQHSYILYRFTLKVPCEDVVLTYKHFEHQLTPNLQNPKTCCQWPQTTGHLQGSQGYVCHANDCSYWNITLQRLFINGHKIHPVSESFPQHMMSVSWHVWQKNLNWSSTFCPFMQLSTLSQGWKCWIMIKTYHQVPQKSLNKDAFEL